MSSPSTRMKIPDLLHREPHLVVDEDSLLDLLGLAFLGRDLGTALDDALAQAKLRRGSWNEEFFARDLFIDDFAKTCASLTVDGDTYPANQRFLRKVLVNVPVDVETVRMRQGILRELLDDSDLRRRFEGLYKALFALMSLFGTPGYQGSLDTSAIHLEILRRSKAIIDRMARDFGDADSELHRLHECCSAVQESREYQTLSELLEYENGMAHLKVDIRLGGDGRIRRVRLDRLQEEEDNQFWAPPWQRFRNRLRFIAGGYDFTNKELMKRIVDQVFTEIAPSLIPLIQLLGHLEFYLCSLKFRELARARGLEVCLVDFNGSRPVQLEGLFNPLLLQQAKAPVPCSIRNGTEDSIVLVTGPNSGGKTRLLQSLAWAAVLGQSGSFAPASAASLPMLNGLFVSLVENESADQTEGRLGRELVRIRSLFEQMRVGSMVVLDELCSGTNPSEGVEVFAMVLRLLDRVKPTAFVTTHFLDFARGLAEAPPVPALEFLQVQLDEDQSSTYQFIEGVAPTSLAALTAARLGVTFERLAGHIINDSATGDKTSTAPAEDDET